MQDDLNVAFRKYDFSFLLMTFCLFLIGILNLYSATHGNPSESFYYKSQIIWFLISMVGAVILGFIDPRNIFRYAYVFYILNVLLLILVLVMGDTALGARRWLVIGPIRFQPSEMMKITLVLAMSRWFTQKKYDREIGFKEIIIPFLMALVPAMLAILQPDLGTGLLMLLVGSSIIFFMGLRVKVIMIFIILGVIFGGVVYKFGLKDYQRKRIITFLDPKADAQGSGYNAIQSEIAIGSGQIIGKGYKKSSQASLSYLPENHTDFIFSVFNEEHGLFGSIVLIVFYLVLIFRFLWLSSSVTRLFDSTVSIGLMSILFWHTFINMSMVTGLLPIVGIPLPFMSYGGSSLLTFGICMGIATTMSNSRNIF